MTCFYTNHTWPTMTDFMNTFLPLLQINPNALRKKQGRKIVCIFHATFRVYLLTLATVYFEQESDFSIDCIYQVEAMLWVIAGNFESIFRANLAFVLAWISLGIACLFLIKHGLTLFVSTNLVCVSESNANSWISRIQHNNRCVLDHLSF